MWKKSDSPTDEPVPAPAPAYTPPAASRVDAAAARAMSTLGQTLTFKGTLTGQEDLAIEGAVDGTVELQKATVTVGKSGRVVADIHAHRIRVAGQVRGNLIGSEEVVIRGGGTLIGNITAPRVILEDGCKFKGSIDMEPSGGAASGKPTAVGSAGVRPTTSAEPGVGSVASRG